MARHKSLLADLLDVKGAVVVEACNCQTVRGVKRITIDVRPYKRLQHRCPHCGKLCSGYDAGRNRPRRWRALDFGSVLVYLRYAPARIYCPDHSVVTESVPWAFPGSRFTKEFDLAVAWQAKHMTRSAIHEYMRIDWQTVGRCVARARKHLDPDSDKRRLNGLVNIGVDETSYRKGHKYMTVVINHDTGEVVWVREEHGKCVFEKFFEALSPEQRASIRYVTGDGARWIDECIKKYTPQATRCIDPFHVVQWAGQAIDKLRTQIWQAMRADNRDLSKQIQRAPDEASLRQLKQKHKEQESLAKSIKGSTYALGKAPEHLTDAQSERLKLIAESQPKLYKGYQLKEELRLILKMASEEAGDCLKQWFWRATHSRIEAFRELGHKVKRHFDGIINTLTTGLSNARIEATNNKIKVLIRCSYGFRNMKSMFAFIKLICSVVDVRLPNRPSTA